jgi:hypothetical protein
MRTNIGAYHSLEAAQRAARALELQISIQNIVVRDQRGRGSRAVERQRDGQIDEHEHADFVLSMSGTAQNIEQARALLRAQSNVT